MAIKHFLKILVFSLLSLHNVECKFKFHEEELESDETITKVYKRWMSHHLVPINNNTKRFEIFKNNAKYILKVNKENKPYKLTLTKFANLTNVSMPSSGRREEDTQLQPSEHESNTGVRGLEPVSKFKEHVSKQIEDISIKTFTGSLSGITYIRKKSLESLSAQELVDCNSENDGCGGGGIRKAFDFIKISGGITTDRNYPYKGIKERCDRSKGKGLRVTIGGYHSVPPNNETALLEAVANQPVIVKINGSHPDFQIYSKGVLTTANCDPTHAMLVVGYGVEKKFWRPKEKKKFWRVKNSYGTDWGEKGYIRIERGIADPQGRCGIAKDPLYPIS